MKYVILIHANPQPWGHPVEEFMPEFQAMSADERTRHQKEFENLMGEYGHAIVGGETLADPADGAVYHWRDGTAAAADGPYAETKEHLVGFFLIDVPTREQAEEFASRLGGPGKVVELRPTTGGEHG